MPKVKKPKKQNLDFKTLGTNNAQVEVPPFHLQNVVSTFSLGCTGLNLHKIALDYKCLEFNPQNFAAATMRTTEPRTTALAFNVMTSAMGAFAPASALTVTSSAMIAFVGT